MKNLEPFAEACKCIEDALAKMNEAGKWMVQPVCDGLTLQEAVSRLDPVLGSYWHIEMKLVNNHKGKKVEWEIWDGAKHHKGANLADVVNTCLKDHNPETGAVDVVEATSAALEAPMPF